MKTLLIDEADSPVREILAALEAESESFRFEWAPDLATAVQCLDEPGVEVILMGLSFPDAWGREAFEKVQAFADPLPIIVMTGPGDAETGEDCVTLGAQDVVPASELSPPLLSRVLRYAVERNRLLSALRDLSVVDNQTELYTLRGLTELGQHHLRAAQRMAQNALLIYVGSQGVNDGGLVALAAVLKSAFRASDVVARVGPSEFAVLAMDADPQSVPILTHRLLDATQRAVLEGKFPPSRFRIGYASMAEMPQATVMELLEKARTGAADAGAGSRGAVRI